MIICSCNVLSDADVRTCVQACAKRLTPAQIHRTLGCSPQCGCCAKAMRDLARIGSAARHEAAEVGTHTH